MIKKLRTLQSLATLALRYSTAFSILKTLFTQRFTVNSLRFLGKTLYYTDQAAFLKTADEIFNREIYAFKAASATPLIIDCGANIGLSSIYFKKLYPEATIIAFEPDDKTFDVLKKNAETYGLTNVDLRKEAVWITDGTISFAAEGNESSHIAGQDEAADTHVVSVKSRRLRTLLEQFPAIDFLKIDIEGAENQVLPDLVGVLNRCQNVFVEYHSFQDSPQQLAEILNVLSDAGFRYKIQEVFSPAQPFIDASTHVNNMDLQLNIFATREA